MTFAVAAPLLCAMALVLALVEIEVEGAYGWAEKLPTPYRVSGPLARLFGAVLGGKPLTGYNLLMFASTLLAFHLPFAFGTSWTAARELALLAAWVSWSALWDLLWFLLNPAYGWRRFRRGNIWWHRRWLWRLPLDYWVAVVVSLALALAAQLVRGAEAGGGAASSVGPPAGPDPSAGLSSLAAQALLLAVFAAWAVLNGLASPLYGRLYRHTHAAEFDERSRVPISPPPGERAPAAPPAMDAQSAAATPVGAPKTADPPGADRQA